jgi:hypothetical protein
MSCIFQAQTLDLPRFRKTLEPRNDFNFPPWIFHGAYMISAWECFHFATLELVRSTPIKQRLICAYRRHLAGLPEDEVPDLVRDSFHQVLCHLRGVQPLRGEDAVAASVRKMSNQEADECAALIVEIFGMMSRAESLGERSNTVAQLQSIERAADYDIPALIANS